MSVFQKLAPAFALAALTAIATPELANAQSYPGGAVIQGVGGQYQPYGNQNQYYGTPMTPPAIQEVIAQGPVTILPYASVGYTEGTFPDGEHVGVRFSLNQNGNAYVAQIYDLNKMDDFNSWVTNINNMARLDDINRDAYSRTSGYYMPSVFRPCNQNGVQVVIAVGARTPGIIFANPYALGHGPFVLSPTYGRHGGGNGAVVINAPIGNSGGSITVVAPIGGGRQDRPREIFNGGYGRHGGPNVVIAPQIVIGGGHHDRGNNDGGRHHRR